MRKMKPIAIPDNSVVQLEDGTLGVFRFLVASKSCWIITPQNKRITLDGDNEYSVLSIPLENALFAIAMIKLFDFDAA